MIEDFSPGCSGPTSVAAPAKVARFVADSDSAATITKPIPLRGKERESNQVTLQGQDNTAAPCMKETEPIHLLARPYCYFPTCCAEEFWGGVGSVDNVWQGSGENSSLALEVG
jgi:hypothetical protein